MTSKQTSLIAKRALNIHASKIRQAFNLALTLKDPIDLSIGQPYFDVPREIKNVAIEAINQGFNRYTVTQGIAELHEKITAQFKQEFKEEPDGLVFTSGGAGAITLAMLTLINEGDEVLIPDPYFALYPHVINMAGGVPKFIDTYPDFRLTKERILAGITPKTKMIIISTPSNPTGIIYTKEEIQLLVEIARSHNLIIMSDEVYHKFVYDAPLESALKYYPQTIMVRSFSKSYGMPGWRLGFAVGPKEIIEKMTVLQQWSFVCAPAPLQKAGVAALDYDMSAQVKDSEKKRDLVMAGLQDNFEFVKPDGAFYFFPKVPWGTDAEFVQAAVKEGVILVPGSAFSRRNTHFRISYSLPDEKLKKGIEILNKLARRK